MEKLKDKINIDQLAKLIGLKQTLDDFDEAFIENNYCQCPEHLRDQYKCKCGFEDERTRLFNQYKNAIETVADNLLREHGLTIVSANKKNGDWEKKIVPIEKMDWRYVCSKLVETINGYGMFEFRDAKELKESGPYVSYKQAALQHLHWIKEWSKIYGDLSAENKVNRLMKY